MNQKPTDDNAHPFLAGIGAGLEGIETFITVADLGSFSDAAKALHLSQPAITARVQKLETFLGVRLFNRTTRSVTLTDEGRELAHRAKVALRDLSILLKEYRRCAHGSRKRIMVASTQLLAATWLPRLVFQYMQRFPDVEVHVHDMRLAAAIQAVESGNCDIGIFALDDPRPRLDFTPLYCDEIVALAPSGHPLEGLASVTLAQLAGYDLMTLEMYSTDHGLVKREFTRQGLPFHPLAIAANHATLVGMFDAGLGVALLPRSMALHNARRPRTLIPLSDASMQRYYGVVVLKDARLSAAASSFKDFVCQSLANQFDIET